MRQCGVASRTRQFDTAWVQCTQNQPARRRLPVIQRVKIEGYKSLQSIEVDLKPLTIIFGPNAAGKSNLFDALSLLSRMATQRNLREAFDEHRGTPLESFFVGKGGLEQLLKQVTAEFHMEVDVELSKAVVDTVE